MIRTGNFRFVLHARIPDHEARGWMVVAALPGRHGDWSVLMWRCDCNLEDQA